MIRTAVVGVGNCFAGLVQGIEFYKKHPEKKAIGIMHEKIAGYSIYDLEFVAAFDVGRNKVGKPLHEAVYASPNMVNWIPKKEFPKSDVVVKESPALDGVGIWVQNRVQPIKSKKSVQQLRREIVKELEDSGAEVIVNYLPVGSQKATEFWAGIALESGCALVNTLPVFIASERKWASKFKKAGIPIIGDDVKSQVGATIVHRTLAKLCDDRGTVIDKTYQINVGGNSVTGDEEILLILDDKIIKTKIGEFVDSWIELYGEKREDGKEFVDVGNTGRDLRCFTVDENFRVVEMPVSKLIRHRLDEELYEIECSEGRKIKVTKDHNLFVLNTDGELEAMPVSQLKEKEAMIAVPRLLPASKKDMESVDLTPYLKDMFARGVDSDGNIIIHNHPEIKIPVKFPITDELLQVVGLWLADGSFDREGSANLEIACGNDPECMEILERFTDLYNVNYTVRGEKQVSVRLLSKTAAKIFKLALRLGGDSYTKRVPGWVFNLSKRQIALVLKGYMSGDGTVIGKQIRWTTASDGLAQDIKTLFMMVGINATLFREDYTKKKNKFSFKTKLENIIHGVISSKEDINEFIERVGFIQSKKNAAALSALRKLTKGYMHIIPKFKALEKWGIRSRAWSKWPTLRAHIILSQLDKVKDEKELIKIRNICEGDVRFLKIKKIRMLKAKPMYVYDLSVPKYERFICSNILVHNTDFLNMKEQERLQSKKISKTEAVQSQLSHRLPDENIYVGPSDFIPFLGNTKIMFMRIEGRMWADIPYNMEVRLEVDDKANSAGVVIDAIRLAKLAMDRKIGGAILPASAYLMKHPPVQLPDPEAKKLLEGFIAGKVYDKISWPF